MNAREESEEGRGREGGKMQVNKGRAGRDTWDKFLLFPLCFS